MIKLLKAYGESLHRRSLRRCEDWSGQRVSAMFPHTLLDVGCGDGGMLRRYLKHSPKYLYGIEGYPPKAALATQRGYFVDNVDINGPWPYSSGSIDVVHSAQVIEHAHNTLMFISEAFRVLRSGGVAVITSENLSSFLNLGALALGYTPFSLMCACGYYCGNPMGLHSKEEIPSLLPMSDHRYSGVTGHNRVMTVSQAESLFRLVGFQVKVTTLGLAPLPEGLGQRLEKLFPRRGHFLLIFAVKP